MSDIIARGMASKSNSIYSQKEKDVSEYFSNNWVDSTSKTYINGCPIISNPDSLIYVNTIGDNGGTTVIFDSIGSKGGFSPSLGGNNNGLITELNDYAYYPYYINRPYPSENRFGSARWKLVGGQYPSGIMEYSYSEGDKTVFTKQFVKSEVAYTVFDLSGINDMRFSTSLRSIDGERDFTGGYETLNGKKYIAVKDNTTGLWFATTCTNMSQYRVCADNINSTLGLDSSSSSVTNSACSIGIGCGSIPNCVGTVVFCTSIGINKNTVVNNVLNGLTNWKEKYEEAVDDWTDFYSGLCDNVNFLNTECVAKYYTCIQQIRSLNYKGYMSAGSPSWTKNFIRDTAWTIYSLCFTKHRSSILLAKDMTDWFAGVDSFVHSNAYTVDKKRCETSMNQTDTAPTFLLAIGQLCKTIDYDTSGIHFILLECLSYIKTYYVADDKHIIAMHAHDFWDDYVEEIDVTSVKYESMVDVLWIAGLEAIEPIFRRVGDIENADYCKTMAENLRSSLDDYRRDDGSLYYAIKNDGSLYSTIDSLPGTLYAAWFLGDKQCEKWVMNYGEHLRIKGGFCHYPLTHSNAISATLDVGAWMPYVPIVALFAYNNGDASLLHDLSSSFKFGGLVEYSTISKTNKLIHSSHAFSFPWAESMYVYMANILK